MNRKIAFGMVAVVLGGALFFLGYNGLAAGSGEPGSVSDPLVTRSFVEEYVGQQLDVGFTWEIANLKAGEMFAGKAGTEVVLRSGRATVVDPTGSGLPNLTRGTNLTDTSAVPSNNLILVPRTDGRGLKATTNIIVMYRGNFDAQ